MSEAATAEKEEKEADHHPYFRPKDAATLILIDRTGANPKVLVGKRHDKVVFMPGKYRLSRRPRRQVGQPRSRRSSDSRRARSQSAQGQPEDRASRARALAIAAIREACEETGLCLGRKVEKPVKLEGAWKPFAEAGLLPDPSGLFLIARAITPPGRVRRFDTRFFTADASAIAHRVEGVIHADAELVELVWVEIGSKPLADAHAMTKNVLGELDTPPRHRPARATTRRCRSSISTAAGCTGMCLGRRLDSLPVIPRGSRSDAPESRATTSTFSSRRRRIPE